MAIAPLAFSQLATTGVTADPRAELERLRKLKRLKELEAKASGAAPQPAPAQPATAGPVNQTDATNPIVAAQRASQVQTGNAFAAQKAEEQRRAAERRKAAAVNMGDFVLSQDAGGNIDPNLQVEGDIVKTVVGSPIQFGQGLAEGTANFINNATNIGAEGLNAANKLLLGDKAFKFTGTDIQVPQNVIVDQGGPLQSVSGMAPRIAGQIMSTRVPLGKVMPGGGVGAEIAKDALSYAAATDKDTQRVSDMLPAGTPLDFLRSREGESYAEAFAKNALEDAGLSAAATALLKGGVKVLDSVGNQPMTPTNPGGANLGSPRPIPPQTPANALASPPAPAQAASAAQPSVVPQPTVSQAGTAGTGQQAGAGVGAGGGGAVPPAGPATLQATPRNVPVAVGKEELAVQRDTLKAVSRFMRGARIPRNVVNDYTASLLSRYEPLKSERYSLAFFVEDDLPQYLQSRGYTPSEARNYAGDTTAKLQGWGRAANSFNESGNSARYLIQDVIHRLTTSQKSELEGTFKAVLGDETLMGRSDEIGALMRQNGEEAYNNSISEANRLIKDGKASPEQVRAAQELNAILTNDGFKQFYPDSLTVEAATRGKTVDQLIQERLAADPIEAAHWLQSEIGKSARNARDGLQKDMASTYEAMRKAILDRLEQFPGYRGARMQHGDLFGADDAVSFGDRFLTAARSEFKTDQMARELEKLSPRQQAVAALSIRDAMLNPLLRGSPEDAAARITELQKEGTLKALVTVLGEERGTELRNAIANMRVENQRISAISQAAGSNTHLNQQGARDAIDNIRSPGNRLVHGAGNPTGWGVAGIASMAMGNPLPLVAKAVASAVDKASTPGARFQSRATKGLYGLPEAVDDAAGAVPPNANALASPPPSGGPTPFGGAGGGNTTGNALSRPPPRTRAQRPPPTMEEWAQRIETDQNELQRLLKQYDQIDRADPNVDDLMRANLAKQKNARRRIAEKTKKMEAARAAQPEPAVPNAPQIAPANAFNAEPQAAAQAAPSGNAFNGKRALPGETSNSSAAIGGALLSGGLTGGATYAATGDEDLALRAGGLAAISGAVAGNRLAKFGGRQPPKPPARPAPVAFKRDPAMANLSPGDMVAYIEAKYPRGGNSPSSPSPYWDAATALKRANGDRAAAAAELQRYADYLKSPEAKATAEQIKTAERTVRAVADVDPIFFDDAAFNASMKGRIEAGGNSAMEQIRGATADDGIGGAMDVANRADDMLPGERPIAPRGKPAPKPPTRQGMGVNASGAGAAGGGILGATLAPDANGDGTVDAQERANGFLGGAFSGGIAGKALGSRAAGKASGVQAQGFGAGRPKPPPNRLASGPPKPKREGPSTASRMVAGGVIGGIAGSAGSADPQTQETAAKIADNNAQLEGALSQIAEFENALKIFSNGTNEEIQRQLDKEGFDLGPTGIDGDIGKNTAAAIRARKAELNKNLEVARTRLKELEGFASELEQQAAFERTRPTDEQQTFRDYAPLLGGIAGALGAKTIRIGGTTASKFTARNAIKKADALLNNTPISTPRNKQERAAIDARATNVNEFFKRGGANKPENMKQRLGMEPRKSVPFESKRDGTMTARPLSKVTAPADLYPDKFFGGRLGPVDALIGGSAATEAVLAGQNAEMVKEKLVAAYETAKDDPSEKNLARIQELEDQYAQAKGLMMLGIGAGIGTGIGVMTSKYASRRANVPMAEQELAILRQYFASRKKPAPKAPPVPKNALASPPLPPARPRRTP